jgi:hypothetical protein
MHSGTSLVIGSGTKKGIQKVISVVQELPMGD